MVLPLIDDFLSIVLKNCSLIDVRAPIEFAKGAFPNTINLPIMSNEERHLIGIRYKNNGNQAAVALGKELIDGSPRKERTEKWKAFVKANPDAYLYCFRGGQRSRITQEWLADEGVNITRLKGGYKAFRNFLMSASEEIAKKSNTIIIGGRTGSGKTLLLDELENSIDLEKLANHRGSSFGSFISAQPAQIDFENSLAYALINHDAKGYNYLIIEHEGRNIGCINIPKNLFDPLQENASLIILETPIQERVDIIYKEYVTDSLLSYHESFEEEGKKRWFEDVSVGLFHIQKRLGSERYLQIKNAFECAYTDDSIEGHKAWIEILLTKYYDPMYDYQIEKSSIPIVFRGDAKAIKSYLTLSINPTFSSL